MARPLKGCLRLKGGAVLVQEEGAVSVQAAGVSVALQGGGICYAILGLCGIMPFRAVADLSSAGQRERGWPVSGGEAGGEGDGAVVGLEEGLLLPGVAAAAVAPQLDLGSPGVQQADGGGTGVPVGPSSKRASMRT